MGRESRNHGTVSAVKKLTIAAFYWRQDKMRSEYNAATVNVWIESIFRSVQNTSFEVVVFTDHPEGIDPRARITPLPEDFAHYTSSNWRADNGLPQCYRRMAVFAPDAGERFGFERLCYMDLDVVIGPGSIDHVFDRPEPLVLFRGTSQKRPYNGSMVMLDAGAAPQVYTDFTLEAAREASRAYMGSDQAWLAYCLGRGYPVFDKEHGVYSFGGRLQRAALRPRRMPSNIRILFFPGPNKPWTLSPQKYGLFVKHWHDVRAQVAGE